MTLNGYTKDFFPERNKFYAKIINRTENSVILKEENIKQNVFSLLKYSTLIY